MSRTTAITRGSVADATAQIVQSARRNNRQDGLTGALLGNETWFVQVLEGPSRRLHSTLNRILADERHHDVFIFEVVVAPARIFGLWDMYYSSLDDVDLGVVWDCVEHFRTRSWLGGSIAHGMLAGATSQCGPHLPQVETARAHTRPCREGELSA
jgi:hypothetical protein